MKPSEEELRTEFERQMKGRDLTRHHLRGTYSSPPIAALWNQHCRTVEWVASLYEGFEKRDDVTLDPETRRRLIEIIEGNSK